MQTEDPNDRAWCRIPEGKCLEPFPAFSSLSFARESYDLSCPNEMLLVRSTSIDDPTVLSSNQQQVGFTLTKIAEQVR